ncbi:MAG TPA: hypothetical protein VGG75_31540 [Trebonia sp.]
MPSGDPALDDAGPWPRVPGPGLAAGAAPAPVADADIAAAPEAARARDAEPAAASEGAAPGEPDGVAGAGCVGADWVGGDWVGGDWVGADRARPAPPELCAPPGPSPPAPGAPGSRRDRTRWMGVPIRRSGSTPAAPPAARLPAAVLLTTGRSLVAGPATVSSVRGEPAEAVADPGTGAGPEAAGGFPPGRVAGRAGARCIAGPAAPAPGVPDPRPAAVTGPGVP